MSCEELHRLGFGDMPGAVALTLAGYIARCFVLDPNEWFEWKPDEYGQLYRECANVHDEKRVVEWDGVLLAAWRPIAAGGSQCR